MRQWQKVALGAQVDPALFLQGQFNFVHVIITPLDYECNLVSLQCRKGKAWGWVEGGGAKAWGWSGP